jgi:2-polyprenyl-6-methoxyphenol hydroxylase-like FAD-dependent oxidoreductase
MVDAHCDWLVAADGASSQVRKSLGLTFDGQVFPKTSITLVLDYPFETTSPICSASTMSGYLTGITA